MRTLGVAVHAILIEWRVLDAAVLTGPGAAAAKATMVTIEIVAEAIKSLVAGCLDGALNSEADPAFWRSLANALLKTPGAIHGVVLRKGLEAGGTLAFEAGAKHGARKGTGCFLSRLSGKRYQSIVVVPRDSMR